MPSSPVIPLEEARLLVKRMGELTVMLIEHQGKGTPEFGPNCSLMARGHMHSVYTHIDRLMFQPDRGKEPYPLALTIQILEDEE
jgi:hypothetical protein